MKNAKLQPRTQGIRQRFRPGCTCCTDTLDTTPFCVQLAEQSSALSDFFSSHKLTDEEGGIREVSFFTRRGGLLKIGGDQVFFLRSKGGIKRFFQIKKGGSLIFFKERKYFDKHFRTQMEFLLILQKRCSYESVSCCNSSKRG